MKKQENSRMALAFRRQAGIGCSTRMGEHAPICRANLRAQAELTAELTQASALGYSQISAGYRS